MNWRRLALVGGGIAAAAGLVAGGLAIAGRRVKSIEDHDRDAALEPPGGVEHHYLETHDGGTLHLVTAGSGPPVILMHGVTLQWWVWAPVIRALSADHTVIAWDKRGHGESEAGTGGVTLDAAADDLAMVVQHFDLHDVIAVGHSMGGMVLGQFAVDHEGVLNDRFAGLVFLATSAAPMSLDLAKGGMSAVIGPAARSAVAGLTRRRFQYSWPDNSISTLLARSAFGPTATGAMVDDLREFLGSVPQETLAQSLTAISEHDVRDELKQVTVPTLVVVGDHDRVTPPAHARRLAKAIPDAHLIELPRIGHQVMQEDPAAIVAAVRALS